eukprot:UN26545
MRYDLIMFTLCIQRCITCVFQYFTRCNLSMFTQCIQLCN